MATVAITCEILAVNVRGADNGDSGNGTNSLNGLVCTTAADGWVISPPAGLTFDERLVLRFSVPTAATFVVVAGARYPAQRAEPGNQSIAMATNDSRMISIETSRFLSATGPITITATNVTDWLAAFMLPTAP